MQLDIFIPFYKYLCILGKYKQLKRKIKIQNNIKKYLVY